MLPKVLLRGVRHQMFLDTLRTTQYLPPAKLQAYQHRLITGLLQHARAQVPFYRDRLAPAFDANGSFDPQGFREIPLLTRTEAQDNAARMQAQDLPVSAGDVNTDATSGSTGQSFIHQRNTLADAASYCLTERTMEWSGADPSGVLADIRIDRNGRSMAPTGSRGGPWSGASQIGRSHRLTIDADIDTQLDWLQKLRPDFLMSYPSNARALAEACEERGLDLPLKRVFTGSESVDPEMRTLFARVFGCAVTDQYGTQEIGYIAGECAECGQYHVAAESVYLELLDEDDAPVAPGEIGRIVLTGFYNYAMPFIRYDIGDYARRGTEEGGCQRILPRLAQIMGRARNMFTFPGGRVIWPNTLQSEIKKYLPVRRMQVVQEAPLDIIVRYTRDANGAPTDLDALTAYMRGKLDPNISVRVDEIDAFEPRPGRKFEDYVSMVSGKS